MEALCRNCDDILFCPMKLGMPEPVDCLVVYIEAAVSNKFDFDTVSLGELLDGYTWLHLSGITPALSKGCRSLVMNI